MPDDTKSYGGRYKGHANTGSSSMADFKKKIDSQRKAQKEKDVFREAHTIKPKYSYMGQEMDEKSYDLAVMAGKGNKGKIMPGATSALDQLQATQKEAEIQSEAQANAEAIDRQNRIVEAQQAIMDKDKPKTGGVLGPGGLEEGDLSAYQPLDTTAEGQTPSDLLLPFSAQALEKNVGGALDVLASDPRSREAIGSVAKVLNKIGSFLPADWRFGGAKSTEVKALEGAFMDADKILDLNIIDVENGIADWTNVQTDIDDAINQINLLEAQTKGLNLLDNRYWLTDGVELDTQIKRQIKILNSKTTRLLEARVKAQANQNMANYRT